MAYEDKTLKDLMDEIRKMEQPEPKKTGVFWEDILDEEPAVAEKTPSINLDVCIRDTLEDLLGVSYLPCPNPAVGLGSAGGAPCVL